MSVAIPAPQGAISPARFLFNAAGAGLGVWAYSNFLYSSMPDWLTEFEIYEGFGGNEIMWGAFALLGAVLGNAVYNRIAGDK